MLRRVLSKFPKLQANVRFCIKKYTNKKFAGTKHNDLVLDQLKLAPPPGNPGRDLFQHDRGFGPVGLLLNAFHKVGAALGDDFVLSQDLEADVHLIDTPWQSIQKVTEEVCQRARLGHARLKRGYLKDLKEIDNVALMSSIRKRNEEDAKILVHCCTSAAWTNSKKAEIGLAADDKCLMCGAKDGDLQHVLWECQAIRNHPEHKDELEVDHNNLPVHLRYGVPGMMSRHFQNTFWGEIESNVTADNENDKEILGLPIGDRKKLRAKGFECVAEKIYVDYGVTPHQNLRQAFQIIRGINVNEMFPLPGHCDLEPPDNINVHTDGSFING